MHEIESSSKGKVRKSDHPGYSFERAPWTLVTGVGPLNPVRLGEPYRADMQHPTCGNISRHRAVFKPFLESKTGVPRAFSGDACRSSILNPGQNIAQAVGFAIPKGREIREARE